MNRPALVWMLLLTGCAGERPGLITGPDTTNPAPSVTIVSDPASVPSPAPPGTAALTSNDPVTYVSLPPGSVPAAVEARIENLRTGNVVNAGVFQGGFDPVAIQAIPGDTLDIVLTDGHSVVSHRRERVPGRRPPRIVRTSPPKGQSDVPLNAAMVIVFSEPVDPATLTGASVQLRSGTALVGGRLEFGDPAHLMATLLPAAPLARGTAYELIITQGIRDLDGDPLEAAATVSFTTTATGLAASVTVTTPFAEVSTATSSLGSNTEQYTLSVSFGCNEVGECDGYGARMVANGTNTIGPHAGGFGLRLDTPPNCTYYLARFVATGNTTLVAFAVTCAARGDLQITATTTGVDLPSGYMVGIPSGYVLGDNESSTSVSVPTSGTARLSGLLPGDYSVHLHGVTPNCEVAGPDPVGVTVPSGGVAAARFTVACAAATELAFVRDSMGNRDIYMVKSNGRGMTRLTTTGNNDAPAWSPDGARLAFEGFSSGNAEIYVMNADGSGLVQLTNHPAHDRHPTWSPDGARIAFYSDRDGNDEIYAMNADGTNPVRLTDDAADDTDPAWSPEGSTIVFVRRDLCDWAGCRGDIYTINPDGLGVAQVSMGGQDQDPAWAPDGARLAFSRLIPIADDAGLVLSVMNADGSGVRTLGGWIGTNPAWSRDGRWLALVQGLGLSSGIHAVRSDGGTGLSTIIPLGQGGFNLNPAWRP